jgi:GPH family glycoside/pentoside/hexuronide:cation symporter
MSDHITIENAGLRKNKIGMAFGSFGANLGAAVIMTYLTIFFTDNMLISAASVSIILLVSRIIDAFSDLWLGSLIDRCKSKMGKARPWLLWMAAPAFISMALLFYVPPLSENGRIIYSFITYNLFAFFYLTALTLPVNTLVSLLTTDSKHRLAISQIFGFFLTLGAVFVNYFSTPIMNALGGGNSGYFWYFTIVGFVGAVFCIICFKLTKEKAKEEVKDGINPVEKMSFKRGAGAALKNIYWWNAMGIYLVTSLVPACWAATAYYCIYWLNGQIDTGHLMALLWGGITGGILLFVPISKKIGKVNSAALGISIQALGSVLLWLAPASIAMVWFTTILRSVGVGGLTGNMRAMLADVVEYGEWKTGVRTEGIIFSGATFGYKVGAGLGGAIVAGLLAWGNYVPNAATQAVKAMMAIKIAFIAVPFIGSTLIVIMLLLFRVEKLMPKILADLEERKKN